MGKTISRATIDRLPLYYRTLRLAQEEGIMLLSSQELGQRLDIAPVQIRKDLAFFGQFGKKGVGYYVDELRQKIGNILGLQYRRRLAIVGVGHLGAALANYKNFPSLGFRIEALFDKDTRIIGSEINGVKIHDSEKIVIIVQRKLIEIGIIAVPDSDAQKVANDLISAGIKGIWNFAPTKLIVPPEISLVDEDLSVGLSALSYHLTQNETKFATK